MTRGVILVILNGPVPAGALANSVQLRPAFFPGGRADHQDARDQIGEVAERQCGVNRHRVVVDLFPALQHADDRADNRRFRRVVLRRFVVKDPPEVEDDRVGVEVGMVVKLGALAQVEDPPRPIDLVDLPAGREARSNTGRLIGVLEVPIDQGVIGGIAEKAEAFAAIRRDAARRRDVGGGHADPHDFVR